MRRSTGLLAALLASLAAAGCIEVENPSVCTTQTQQVAGGGSITQDVPLDIGKNLPVNDLDLSVRVEQLVVSTADAAGNFNGMTSASWSIVPATGAPVPVASYTQGGAAPGKTVAFTIPSAKPDLGQYILSGTANFRFAYSGTFPLNPMNVDFLICVSLKAKKRIL
jgi:hypothetical protein